MIDYITLPNFIRIPQNYITIHGLKMRQSKIHFDRWLIRGDGTNKFQMQKEKINDKND